jgi:PIN domain nuclease of toxin-antitoxin system
MAHKYVLDTRALVWHLEGNPRLGPQARKVIDDPLSSLVLPILAITEAA